MTPDKADSPAPPPPRPLGARAAGPQQLRLNRCPDAHHIREKFRLVLLILERAAKIALGEGASWYREVQDRALRPIEIERRLAIQP